MSKQRNYSKLFSKYQKKRIVRNREKRSIRCEILSCHFQSRHSLIVENSTVKKIKINSDSITLSDDIICEKVNNQDMWSKDTYSNIYSEM